MYGRKKWRNFKNYRIQNKNCSLRNILVLAVAVELAYFGFCSFGLVSISEKENVFQAREWKAGPNQTYGVRIKWKDGEIEVYRTDQIPE